MISSEQVDMQKQWRRDTASMLAGSGDYQLANCLESSLALVASCQYLAHLQSGSKHRADTTDHCTGYPSLQGTVLQTEGF